MTTNMQVERLAADEKMSIRYLPRLLDSWAACLGYHFAFERGVATKYLNLIFAHRWINGRDIADVNVLAETAEILGQTRADFLADNRRITSLS